MKCLNCGQETNLFLCGKCQTEPILDKVFNEIRSFKPDTCTNPHLLEYASALTEKYEERNCIPEILDLFDFDISPDLSLHWSPEVTPKTRHNSASYGLNCSLKF